MQKLAFLTKLSSVTDTADIWKEKGKERTWTNDDNDEHARLLSSAFPFHIISMGYLARTQFPGGFMMSDSTVLTISSALLLRSVPILVSGSMMGDCFFVINFQLRV